MVVWVVKSLDLMRVAELLGG